MSRSLSSLREGLEGFSQPPSISIKGGNFVLVDKFNDVKKNVSMFDTATKQKYFDAIILDVNPHFSRVYYEGPFDERSPVGPVCFSDNNIGPSINADRPQSPSCRQCRWQEWGTAAREGSRAKACKEQKKLALMVPDFDTESVWLLRVPPTSKNALGAFTRQLDRTKIGERSALPIDVITRISFVDGELFKLEFSVLRSLHDAPEDIELYEAAVAHFESGLSADIVGLNDKPIDPQLALPAPTGPTMQRLPAPVTRVAAAPVRPAATDSGIIDVEGIDVATLPRRR